MQKTISVGAKITGFVKTKPVKKAWFCRDKEQKSIYWNMLYAETAGKAKSIHCNSCFDDATFLTCIAKRDKMNDLYAFEGREMTLVDIKETIELRNWRAMMQKMVDNHPDAQVRIYSGQWSCYWAPNGEGYADKENAGIYDIADAWRRTSHCGLEKKISFEIVK